MLSIHRTCVILVAALSLAGLPLAAFGQHPAGVSPGAEDRVPRTRDECPSFSWTDVPRTAFYELVVYRIANDFTPVHDAGLDLERASEVLYTRVPGGATGWTPALDQCLAPGGRYAWFVRAVLDPEADTAGEWSEPLLFEIAAAPSAQELEYALSVLERYRVHGSGEGAIHTTSATAPVEPATVHTHRSSPPAKVAARSVLTGNTAIRGDQPESAGDTYGVVGVSASPAGAGLGAANTGGGPDLVLDGSAGGATDTELSEAGLDRRSTSLETFEISNSGGGGMTLQVDGIEVVTTATDRDTLAGLSCAAHEVTKWDGSAWICAPDVDTDTDTLASLAPLCASGELARWSGGGWLCSPDRDTLATLSCATPGLVAKWNGKAWVCARDEDTTYTSGPGVLLDGGRFRIDPAAFFTRITTLDMSGDVGESTSVAIGSDGLPLISYIDRSNLHLKAAHCDDVLCSSASTSTVDSSGNAFHFTSVGIGADGLGLISYRTYGHLGLTVAHCDDVLCSSATITELDTECYVGYESSLAIGADGLGLISYHCDTSTSLKVAHCDDALCSSVTNATVDNDREVGRYNSLVIGADGLGLISYFDDDHVTLKVAHCEDLRCTAATVSTVDATAEGGIHSSLTVGADGLGLISYCGQPGQSLRVAHCDDVPCTSATLSTVDSPGVVGWYTSVEIGANGLGLISHYDQTNSDLKLARCKDVLCTTADHLVVDSEGDVGEHGSLTIGADGLGLISYYDETNGDLKVVHLPYGL